MAIFLSPGVYPKEIDLSVLPADTSSIIPAFIGTANRGPMNKPMFISTTEEFVNVFGTPFPQSYLGYAVFAFLQQGNACWVLRVGVEAQDGQDPELAAIAIDTSGSRNQGWGRISVFSGIDFGKIRLRIPTLTQPFTFQANAVNNITYNEFAIASSFGPAAATLDFLGAGLSNNYIGPINDSFTLLITSAPVSGLLHGCGYEIIRGSDGVVINTGFLVEASLGLSTPVIVGSGSTGTGLILAVQMLNSAQLNVNDTFTWEVVPNNLTFSFEVEGLPSAPVSFMMPSGVISDPTVFVSIFNTVIGLGEPFIAVYDGTNLEIRTSVPGERIQVTGTEAFCLTLGISNWTYDIPRSHITATNPGPFNIGTANNQAQINVIESGRTTSFNSAIPVGLGYNSNQIASALDLGGIYIGQKYYDAFAIHVDDNDKVVIIAASAMHQFGQVQLLADFSHLKTLQFAETLQFTYPYTGGYRSFQDARTVLPAQGNLDPSVPLSCESAPLSAQCALDASYYQNVVGWFVGTSAGTWLNGWSLNLAIYNNQPGLWTLKMYDPSGAEDADSRVDNISFDPTSPQYIANIINPNSTIGGVNGHPNVNWEDRPAFLQNDPVNDPADFVVRQPGPLNKVAFTGMQNGIPQNATFSSAIDQVTIGNPAISTGIFAFQNPDVYNITLLLTPGNSSGAVIGQALAMCESRGDVLYLVDPPFGLRPQQVVDWHNGMLLSDLSAALNSSYGALYWGWLKINDVTNGGQIFVPPSGYMAGVFAKTARDAELWFAPAGLNRGVLTSVLDVEYNPTQGERDLLYGFGNAVNPIVNFPDAGITVWGQRTLLRSGGAVESALDRVNVRMLLIALKKELIPLYRTFIFEPNDPILWGQVVNATNPVLADIAARRGITAYTVICNASNNTPIRRDRNELWVSILIKPTRAVEFVVLNLVVLRTDASFAADEVLQAAGVTTGTS